MKREVLKRVNFCDGCDREMLVGTVCLQCGQEYCYVCQNQGKFYRFSPDFTGSQNGFYCQKCVEKGLESTDLLNAYQRMKCLIDEMTKFTTGWRKQVNSVEKTILEIRGKQNEDQ